jgi:lysozyme
MLRSRPVRTALAGLVLLGTVAALGWYVALPRYRPSLQPGEHHGVDVSHHQGPVDWARVADDGISFAYVKATEGETLVDPRFTANWTGAAEAGLARGAYHFFSLCSPGAGQARNYLATVPRDPNALPPVVDLEFGACRRRPDRAVVQRELLTFVDLVERDLGEQVVLYVMRDFAENYPIPESLDRNRWERRLFRRPDTAWTMWQVSPVARVDGVSGPVDLNVARIGRAGG